MAPIFHRSIPAQPRSFKSTVSTGGSVCMGKLVAVTMKAYVVMPACYMVTFVVMACCTDCRGSILDFLFHTDTFTVASSNS